MCVKSGLNSWTNYSNIKSNICSFRNRTSIIKIYKYIKNMLIGRGRPGRRSGLGGRKTYTSTYLTVVQ